MSELQLISYIRKVKAKSRTSLYKGRRTKTYEIPGTEEFALILEARRQLMKLIIIRKGIT